MKRSTKSMIAKQVQGSDFRKVLDYVHNKSGARLIGSNMVAKEPDSLAAEFRVSSNLRRKVSKCVYHASLSVSGVEKLSDRKWVQIARSYLKGMKFDENQYAIYRHTDTKHDHIHIIASRIRIIDGSAVSDSWQHKRAEVLVRQLEQQFGLFPTQCSWEKSKKSPTTGEIRRQRRTGEVNKRSQLQRLIEQSLKDHPSLEEFTHRLTAKGVSVRLRKSKDGKIEGISYKLDGVAFQGRQLGKDYSWTSLESLFTTESECQLAPLALPETPPLVENSEKTTISPVQVGSEELVEPKQRLRTQYVNLASQVRKFPQFQHRPARDIDIGVTLLALRAGNDIEQAKMILTQSDTLKQWHQELPRDTYLKLARQYIQQIANKAIDLIEKHRSRNKTLELD
ncbi:MAG: relaxase/mobilization nuclease domain-containing protein [Xenococcaceae cyanobacterium]